MKRLYFLLVCVCVLVSIAEAQQKPRRRLSYSELFAEIQNHPDTIYRLENAEIYYKHETDSLRFGSWLIADKKSNYNPLGLSLNLSSPSEFANYFSKYEKVNKYLDSLLPIVTINKSLEFKGVIWETGSWNMSQNLSISLNRFHFAKKIKFNFDKNAEDILPKSEIKAIKNIILFSGFKFIPFFIKSEINDIEIYRDPNLIVSGRNIKIGAYKKEDVVQTISFFKCKIKKIKTTYLSVNYDFIKSYLINSKFVFTKSLTFEDCEIGYLETEFCEDELLLKRCTFNKELSEKSHLNSYGLSFQISSLKNVKIDSCTFEKVPDEWRKDNPDLWNEAGIKDVTCEKLVITNSVFNSHFYLVGTKITEEIFLENNQFNDDFSLGSGSAKSGFERNIINFENAFMPFKQFKKGLSTEIGGKQTTVYYGNTPEQLADSVEYEHLLTYYNKFYKMYQDQKDRASANACFVALKRLETRRLGYLASKDRTNFALFIEWQFNHFLDYTCEYGTNPFLALAISIKIMLIFGLLLSVFPSEKDYLHPSEFRGALQRWGLALQKEGGFTEIQNEKIQEKFNNLENFRKSLELTEGNVPSVLAFFLKPLLFSAKLYYRLQMWFLRKIDFTKGNWQEMSKRRRFWVSTRIFFAILFLLFWGLVMRIVNSMALSMNCFVTLGYGEIKAKGIAKYLVVIEGVLGWIMLTVFSASLITQLMG